LAPGTRRSKIRLVARASCRQLEARDAHAVPGDAAKAGRGFKDEIMVRCLVDHVVLAFAICHGTRRAKAGNQPDSCGQMWLLMAG
jgi:hypothetical protein